MDSDTRDRKNLDRPMKEKKIVREQAAREIGRKQRYVLIGAALGLYYGIFYRPTDTTPDYGIAVILSIVAAAVTVAVRFWKKKASFTTLIKSYFETFLFYLVLLLTLAVRQLAEQIGGRFGLTLVTTLVGIGMGYFMATRTQLPEPNPKNKT